MDEYIKKKDALNIVESIVDCDHDIFSGIYSACSMIDYTEPVSVKEILKDCWISCNERLPEKDGRYLVTNEGWNEWTVDWNGWVNGQWLYNSKPIAWMPLPEPYQGGER